MPFALSFCRRCRTIVPASMALATTMSFAPPLGAAVLQVPGDHASIQEALDAALDGDEVVVAAGTWAVQLEFPPRAITLRSASGNADDTILDGSGPDETRPGPVIRVTGDPDGEQRVEGFSIRHGAGGIVASFTDDPFLLTVESCRLHDNTIQGAIRASGGRIEAYDCEFRSNEASFSGGAMYLGGSAVVERCVFRDNAAVGPPGWLTQGGAIYHIPFGDPGATLLVRDSEFHGNTCTDYGGAIHLSPDGTATISSNAFFANTAGICAGAVYLFQSANTLIENNLMVGNESLRGASIGVDGGSWTIIRGNTILGSKGSGDSEGIRLSQAFIARVENNIVAHGQGFGIQRVGGTGGAITCNDWYENALGDHVVGTPDPSNFSADPLFCSPENRDFSLREGSPCAPPGPTDCGLVGAFPVGCGPVSVRAATWATIKARYR